jgi:hypothetical protein
MTLLTRAAAKAAIISIKRMRLSCCFMPCVTSIVIQSTGEDLDSATADVPLWANPAVSYECQPVARTPSFGTPKPALRASFCLSLPRPD